MNQKYKELSEILGSQIEPQLIKSPNLQGLLYSILVKNNGEYIFSHAQKKGHTDYREGDHTDGCCHHDSTCGGNDMRGHSESQGHTDHERNVVHRDHQDHADHREMGHLDKSYSEARHHTDSNSGHTDRNVAHHTDR